MAHSPEEKREYMRRWREANREQLREYQREYMRDWREANREQLRENARRYYKANRDQRREQQRRYREANREKERLYRENNRDRHRSYHMRHKHGLRPDEWAALYETQHGRCYLCGEEMAPEDASVDHDHSCCPPATSCQVCRRGLAHSNCNSLIGMAADDISRLRRIADALEAAQAAVENRKAAMSQQLILDIS